MHEVRLECGLGQATDTLQLKGKLRPGSHQRRQSRKGQGNEMKLERNVLNTIQMERRWTVCDTILCKCVCGGGSMYSLPTAAPPKKRTEETPKDSG